VDGVSVARGAIGNPWIFQQIRALSEGRNISPPTLHQQREVIAEHYRLAEEIYGQKRCSALMRKFGIKYSRLHPRAAQVREAFIAVKEPADWHAVLEKWYAEDLPGILPESVDKDYYR
jgi:tRNA-dihydrouridine synthase B